jgi:thymidylate synthase (FAD)
MKLIGESVDLFLLGEPLDTNSEAKIGQFLESCGRVCYKSEDKITEDSYKKFLKTIIKSGHESILEHISISAKIVTNRGITHELVRHRLGNFSQESTRYCNYSGNRFGNELSFVIPVWVSDEEVSKHFPEEQYDSGYLNNPIYVWVNQMQSCEDEYLRLLQLGWTPEKAREILPNSLATTIMTTFNVRQWRHVIEQRLSPKCHPQMRYVMIKIAEKFNEYLPLFFSDVFSRIALSITNEQSVVNNEAFQIIKNDILRNC